ncbi:NACHT and WD repeat domain-containing protein [Streptomyces parvulus]|uniref:NACHT and WD repeat domain-containing protein n=1 Tax=Streptomyces parvulus TaxID=146923 RepID=UPI0033C9B3B8
MRYWHECGRSANTVLVWVGHGATDLAMRSAELFVRGDPGEGTDTTVEPIWLAKKIRDHLRERHSPDAWTIVVVEACGGARFTTEVDIALMQQEWGRRTLVIGSGRGSASQYPDTLAADLKAVLSQVTEDVLTLDRLASLLASITDADGLQRYSVRPHNLADSRLKRVIPGPVTAVWSDYKELRQALDGIPADSDGYQALIHFATKGTGTDLGEFAWHFVGRWRERREVFRWLRRVEQQRDTALLVVCGPPGSGKSALLGSILIDCHPDLAEGLERVMGKRSLETPAAPLPAFDLILHLTGATVRGIATQILAGLRGSEIAADLADPVAAVHRETEARREPLLVMADALDESEEPIALAHFFDELLKTSGVHMIIGTRTHSADGRTELTAILTNQGAIGRETLPLEPSPDDVVDSLAVRVRDLELREVVRRSLARRSAETGPEDGTPKHQFLWAAMAAEELNVRSTELRSDPELLQQLLGTDHRGLFRLALERLDKQSGLTRTALLALALAHGRGLPRQDRIWEEATSALSSDHQPVTLNDLNGVLDAAGAYVMLDHEHGQGAYRLVHRVLQEQLLEEADDLPSKRLYVFRQLLARVRPDQELNPYLRIRLSTHAAHALSAAWAELGGRPDVLDRLDPYAVASDALRTDQADGLPVAVLGTITTAHLVRQGGGDDRPGLRMLGEARVLGGTRRPETVVPGTWSVRWSSLPQQPVHLPVGEADQVLTGARALVLVPRDGARGVLAVAAGGTLVRIWDPVTGQPAGASFDVRSDQPLPPFGHGVAALAVLEHHGRSLLAGVPMGGQVVVWDPFTGRREPTSIPSGAAVDGIAAYRGPDGSTRLVLARAGGKVERIEPMTGRVDGSALDAGGPISAILAVAAAGATVIVVLTQSGAVSAWNAETGRAWSRGARVTTAGVSMTVLEASDAEIVLAVLDSTGTCYRCCLRPDAQEAVQPGERDVLARSERAHRAITLRKANGRRLLATADENGGVKVWDPDQPGDPIAGWQSHRDPVDALVAGEATDGSGWALATIAKGAGVARIWPVSALDMPTGPAGERQVARAVVAGPLAALAGRTEITFMDVCQGPLPADQLALERIQGLTAVDGNDPLIVAATRTWLRTWRTQDLSDTQAWPHPDPVRAVTAVPEQADLLISLDVDGVLRRWDVRHGRPEPQTAETHIADAVGMAAYWDEDNVVVAVGGAGVVQRWRCRAQGAPTWMRLADVNCVRLPLALCAVSGDTHGDPGRLFVVTSDQILCAAGRGGPAWRGDAPGTTPRGACAWRDGHGVVRLAVGSRTGQISLIDGSSGRPTRTIPTGLGINCLTTTVSDGRRSLVVGAREGAVAIDLGTEVQRDQGGEQAPSRRQGG